MNPTFLHHVARYQKQNINNKVGVINGITFDWHGDFPPAGSNIT